MFRPGLQRGVNSPTHRRAVELWPQKAWTLVPLLVAGVVVVDWLVDSLALGEQGKQYLNIEPSCAAWRMRIRKPQLTDKCFILDTVTRIRYIYYRPHASSCHNVTP